ncbi:MAG: ion channel [Bacteroidota bacterium]
MGKRRTNNGRSTEFRDLGFGTSIGKQTRRLINTDGSFNVVRTGGGLGSWSLYQYLITISWWEFSFWVTTVFILFNSLFAFLYMLVGVEHLTGAPLDAYDASLRFLNEFGHAFYFSVQTFTTVGYGSISPIGHAASMLSAFESMFGLLAFALATGVLYGRFSRPSVKIRFSKHAIISPYRKTNSFQFRIVNRRQNQLIELEVTVVLMKYERKGKDVRQKFYPLKLERNRVALFPLTWTIVHPINEESPLFMMTPEQLKETNAEFLILIKGYDDTFAQMVHDRMSYKADDVLFGARFVSAFYTDKKGNLVMEVNKVDLCERAELNVPVVQ